MRYCMLYLVIHSSASQRPCVRIPEITFTSFRSICSHCPLSWYLESHAHLWGHHQLCYVLHHCPLPGRPSCALSTRGPQPPTPAHPRGSPGRCFWTHPKPWPLRRALLAVQEEYQPVYCSGLEQLIWSGVTAPDSKPRGLW